MRFRISGAINKAGWAKGGVENISGPRQPGGPGMPGNGRCRDSPGHPPPSAAVQVCATHLLQ